MHIFYLQDNLCNFSQCRNEVVTRLLGHCGGMEDHCCLSCKRAVQRGCHTNNFTAKQPLYDSCLWGEIEKYIQLCASGNGPGASFILLTMQWGFAASSPLCTGELPQSQPHGAPSQAATPLIAHLITHFLSQSLPYSCQGSVCQGAHSSPRDLTITVPLKYFCGIE